MSSPLASGQTLIGEDVDETKAVRATVFFMSGVSVADSEQVASRLGEACSVTQHGRHPYFGMRCAN